jgi:carbon storage regulator CsrA
MLVLTRKVQEQIKVGDNITITIIRVKGQSVRVGIEAPRDVRVMRSELSADLAGELTHETDASDALSDEETQPHSREASRPENTPAKGSARKESVGEVVGPRRVTATRIGPLTSRVARQTVAEMLEMTPR